MFTSENKNPACLEIPEKSNSQTGNRADERRKLELKISLTSFLSNWLKSLPLKQSIIFTISFSYLTKYVYFSTIDTAHFSLTHYYMLYCCTFENKDITHLVADIAKETRTQGNIHINIHLQAKDSCTGTLNNLLVIQKAAEECECLLPETHKGFCYYQERYRVKY